MALANCVTYYCVARSVQKRRIFRTAFWSAVSYFLTRNIGHTVELSSMVVKSIHLHEDGTHVDATFLDNSVATLEIGTI